MAKEMQTVLIVAVMIVVFGVGFVTGYLVNSKTSSVGINSDSTAAQNSTIQAVQLSEAGQRIATGLLSACGSTEPLAIHNCATSNEMKRMIESLIASGLSEQQVRESLINTYGKRIVAGHQEGESPK